MEAANPRRLMLLAAVVNEKHGHATSMQEKFLHEIRDRPRGKQGLRSIFANRKVWRTHLAKKRDAEIKKLLEEKLAFPTVVEYMELYREGEM